MNERIIMFVKLDRRATRKMIFLTTIIQITLLHCAAEGLWLYIHMWGCVFNLARLNIFFFTLDSKAFCREGGDFILHSHCTYAHLRKCHTNDFFLI